VKSASPPRRLDAGAARLEIIKEFGGEARRGKGKSVMKSSLAAASAY
jgi:hypothetical protein